MIAEIKANKDKYDALLIHKTDRFALDILSAH
jgi:hypothetical protein